MAKSISVSQQAALDAGYAPVAVFVEIDWPTGMGRYVTAGADISWNGFTWTAIGGLIDIGAVQESEELRAYGIQFTLSGVTDTMRSLALGQHVQGRAVRMWFAPFDANSFAIIDSPILEYEGESDVLNGEIAKDGNGRLISTLVLMTEDEAAVLMDAAVRRYSDEDQQFEYADDTFFRYVSDVERLLVFPSAEALGRR